MCEEIELTFFHRHTTLTLWVLRLPLRLLMTSRLEPRACPSREHQSARALDAWWWATFIFLLVDVSAHLLEDFFSSFFFLPSSPLSECSAITQFAGQQRLWQKCGSTAANCSLGDTHSGTINTFVGLAPGDNVPSHYRSCFELCIAFLGVNCRWPPLPNALLPLQSATFSSPSVRKHVPWKQLKPHPGEISISSDWSESIIGNS